MMKNCKLLWLAVLIFGTACTSTKSIHSLSIKTSIDQEAEHLSVGDSFELAIEARDSDGIESVTVDIPALGLNTVHDQIAGTKWKTTQTIVIDANATPGKALIFVLLKDRKGEENQKTSALNIK